MSTNVIVNNGNSNNNNNTKTTHTGLQMHAHKNIDGENNRVTKDLMDSMLIIERIFYPV